MKCTITIVLTKSTALTTNNKSILYLEFPMPTRTAYSSSETLNMPVKAL